MKIDKFETSIEPFRIKSIENINPSSRFEREKKLKEVKYNLFSLRSKDVIIDLLTDSGTGAMSSDQWSEIMRGDESYAGSPSFERFKSAVKGLMPFKHIIPTHQGRAAEAILLSLIGGKGKIFLANTHFDTTRGNIEATGATAIDLGSPPAGGADSFHPFKGNIDTDALGKFLTERANDVAAIILTITNNAGGGQPVSLANIRSTAKIAQKYNKLFIIDGCRFAENAYFIKNRENGQFLRPIKEIVRNCFSVADGMTMSAKKDAFGNIGGWLALNDDSLAERARVKLIQTEGFPTYGGLAGRDLDAIAQGLSEIVDENYLQHRIQLNEYIVERLVEIGIPVVRPAGGHAVFIDAKKWLPNVPPLRYPAHTIACKLYEVGGIRSCEIGSVMFGKQIDGGERPAEMELVRLAFPRRTYTRSHIDYLIEVLASLEDEIRDLKGFKIVKQTNQMRHFTCEFEKIE
ncbi:tryptophanase [uncultured Roseibium sp.]|uniref:tryptophanase n=1 Tax=uncultured Roseibium sp. TaxID=1936171 RepID=UPI002607E778|nr:tryptophanase [uncultured Roseibium sp.]